MRSASFSFSGAGSEAAADVSGAGWLSGGDDAGNQVMGRGP